MKSNLLTIVEFYVLYSVEYEIVSNRTSDGMNSFVFKALRRRIVVYIRGAILYTGVMFLRECICLINKISTLILKKTHANDVASIFSESMKQKV